MQTVKETVDSLNQSFIEFKTAQEEKQAEMESKGCVDPLLEEKLSKLERDIDQTQDRLSRIEVSRHRPLMNGEMEMPENQEHKSAFLNYVCKGDEALLHNIESKALSVGSEPDGGYLVPNQLNLDIERNLKSDSVMRRLAKVIQISTDAVELLIDKGDADAGWVAETGERAETASPKLVKIKIPVHELYAKPRATQKLLDDSRVDVESWLSKKIAHKLSQLENRAFIHGDGTNKPKGFLSYQLDFNAATWGKLQGFKTGKVGGFSDDIGTDILIDMINAMKPELMKDSVWLMSRSAHGEVRKLKDSQGNYLWTPGLENDVRPKLLGYPVELTDDMPALERENATSSIAFANFNEGYQIVDRAGIRVLRDPYSVKPYVEFYTTTRVGGDVVNYDAFKVLSFAA